MIKLSKYIFWIVIVITAISCEKVIDLDLNSSDPVLVAEGAIQKDSTTWIRLSYTSDYFEAEESASINDAVVIITADDGQSETLSKMGNGYYQGNTIIGTEKSDYKIAIQHNGETYEASTFIHSESVITDVKFEEIPSEIPGLNNSINSEITFTDEIGVDNFYMIKFIINDTIDNFRYTLISDESYSDNGIIKYLPMMLFLELEDELEIQLFSIDEDTYRYYSQLNDQGSNMMNSSTPYNARSNFGSEVMGYFAGWSIAYYKTTVQL